MGGRGANFNSGKTINYTNSYGGGKISNSANEAIRAILSSPYGTKISVRANGFGSSETVNFEISAGKRGLSRLDKDGRREESWKFNRQNVKSRIIGGLSGSVTIIPPRK